MIKEQPDIKKRVDIYAMTMTEYQIYKEKQIHLAWERLSKRKKIANKH